MVKLTQIFNQTRHFPADICPYHTQRLVSYLGDYGAPG